MSAPDIRPWSLSVPRPTCVLTAGCPPEQALAALAEALRAHRGFRLRVSTARTVEAVAGHQSLAWFSPLQGAWPWGTYGTLIAMAEPADPAESADPAQPATAGARVRVSYPRAASDAGAGRHVAATLDDMVRRLEAAGVRVDVGLWESGLVAR